MRGEEEEPTGPTPVRKVRIADAYWYPAKSKARRKGTTISAKIRGWIIEWVEEDDK